MAISFAHQFGEFLGKFFEQAMKKPVQRTAKQYGLYFDSYGYRKTRNKEKLTWEDIHGSHHDLDYVIEDGGTEDTVGTPVAFIELAWRRYTKHSKNKVQEIEAAIDPIYEKYRIEDPFKGVILCGDFTQNSLTQLHDDRFHVLHISYSSLVEAFKKYGVDIYYDENTTEEWLASKMEELNNLEQNGGETLANIAKQLILDNKPDIDKFLKELSLHFGRRIKNIRILPLHGVECDLSDIGKAIAFIDGYHETNSQPMPLKGFILWVKYNNGDEVRGDFKTKESAIDFLSQLKR